MKLFKYPNIFPSPPAGEGGAKRRKRGWFRISGSRRDSLNQPPHPSRACGAIHLPPRGGKGKGRLAVARAGGMTLLMALALPAFAVQPDEILKDPLLEARARELSGSLRCLVCQNQSIDDSDAPLARDLRLLIREHLVKGETNAAIFAYVTDRYGDFVLLKPRLNVSTLLLWFAPFAVLLMGIFALWRRSRRSAAAEQPLNEAEKAALRGMGE